MGQILLALIIIWTLYKIGKYIAGASDRREAKEKAAHDAWVWENVQIAFQYRTSEIQELEEWWELVEVERMLEDEEERRERLLAKYGR